MKFGKEIGIDLGTTNTRIWTGGKVVLNQPSVIALDRRDQTVLAVGSAAQEMIGRAPEEIELIRPVKDGHLDHYEMAGTLLLHFLGGPSRWRSLLRTKVVMGLPTQATKIQQLALQDALQRAGAGNVGFVSGIASAAVGAGIDPTQPGGWLLVDFGGGALDVAIVSMGGVVSERCLRIGGLALDEAVGTHIRRRFNVTIGERTTEVIKIELGNAVPGREESREYRGVCHATGLPVALPVSNREVYAAMRESVASVVTAVKQVLEEAPPELASDLIRNGVLLCGGSSLLNGFEQMLSTETGLPVRLAEGPGECLIRGIGRIIDDAGLRKRIPFRRVA